ncbi:transglutaminase-like enzyme, predicted cysteine protease [Cryptosporangium arvum DSM 44712]|uniref:Transglutaminase-like enzyme, predicted cysteine protease n=1 Tax=Cryptosporangium arvum DSM 44712 TaxID=927661 RepID=A0A010ZYH1_9ACTN|nr:transglutaminase-like enzyme, predicted cysteine protease [Cryptosporangium arvum DSM 44712]
MVAAGAIFGAVFELADVVVPLVLAVVVPLGAIAIALLRLGRPLGGGSHMALVAAGLAVFAVAVSSSPRHLVAELTGGWIGLFAITLPAPARPDLVAVPFVLLWVGTTLAADLAVRSRSVLLPMVPAAALLTVGLAVALPAPAAQDALATVLPGALVLAAAFACAIVSNSDAGRRTAASVQTVALLLVATVAGVAGTHLEPADPRSVLPLPVAVRPDVNPLDRVSAWLVRPNDVLFTAAAAAGARCWRLTTLSRFDGLNWTAGTTSYTPAGLGVPPSRERTEGPVSIAQRVTIAGLGGTFLPALDRPVRLRSGVDAVDTETGDLLSIAPVERGRTYALVSVPLIDPTDTRPASGPTDALSLPAGLPDVLDNAVEASPGTSAYARIVAMQKLLRDDYRNDPLAESGHTYGDVRRFLTRRSGTTEQFAVTLALAARRLGVPSRIVVGFCPSGRSTVLARDVSVWTEVHLAGGWAGLQPAGPARPARKARVEAPAEVPLPTAAPPPAARPDALAPSSVPQVVNPRLRSAPTPTRPIGVWATAALLILAAAYVTAAQVVPRLRRRTRRRLLSPRGRTAGAWEDLIETLAGDRIDPRIVSSSESVLVAASELSTAAIGEVRPLAALADAARYSRIGPTETDAQSAWWFADRARRRLSRARAIPTRLVIALSPRRIWPQPPIAHGRSAGFFRRHGVKGLRPSGSPGTSRR